SASTSRRQINTCLDVVIIRVDEKGAIERFSAHAGFTVASCAKAKPGGMELIDALLGRCAERQMDGAVAGLMSGIPERGPARSDDEERRVARAGAEDKPSGSVGLRVVFQQPVPEWGEHGLVEAPAAFQVPDNDSNMVEHACFPLRCATSTIRTHDIARRGAKFHAPHRG